MGNVLAVLLLTLTARDPRLTPGALCTSASDRYAGLKQGAPMCRRHVTASAKRAVFARYRIPWGMRDLYEVDHFVPLCLGGSNELANLWPEPWTHAHRKDAIEARLCAAFRKGAISQRDAVAEISR